MAKKQTDSSKKDGSNGDDILHIGIDLGTANTLVYVRDKGIVELIDDRHPGSVVVSLDASEGEVVVALGRCGRRGEEAA